MKKGNKMYYTIDNHNNGLLSFFLKDVLQTSLRRDEEQTLWRIFILTKHDEKCIKFSDAQTAAREYAALITKISQQEKK